MYKGLRKEFLEGVMKNNGTEANIVHAVLSRHGQIEQEAQQWRNLWQTILRFFFPSLNNVYFEGTGGNIRFNEIYSSTPATDLLDVVDFLTKSMFPETYSWIKTGVYYKGRPLEKGKLSTSMLQYLEDVEEVTRYMMMDGNFYSEIRQFILHFLLLGNSALRAIPKDGSLFYVDCPIHRLGVQRDSRGDVYAMGWTEKYAGWEIINDYGEEGFALFKTPNKTPANPYQYLNPIQMDAYSTGGIASGGMLGQSLGTVEGSVSNYRKVEEVVRLLIPHKTNTGIPNPVSILPKMEYICYVVTVKTRRLLDVEFYPVNPIGVASDIRVVGEQYGRGMCGRALPDVGVLNKKKYYSLLADGVIAQSPVIVAGQGLVKPPGETLKPHQLLHAKTGTKIESLYDLNGMFKRKQALYEEDNMNVKRALRKDKVEMELVDRMTATEFTHRQDLSQGVFAPMVGSIYKGILPILSSTVQYAILTGRLEQPPDEMFLSGLDFKIETFSTFSYGQISDKAMNFTRAMAPFGELFQAQPDVLDNVDFHTALRSNFAQYNVSDFLNSLEKVKQDRIERAQREQGAGPAGPVGAEQQGLDKAVSRRAERDAMADGSDQQARYMAAI